MTNPSNTEGEKTSKLQQFAIDKFGIKLTDYQIEVIEAWTDNKIMLHARQSGRTTASKILRAYVKESL